MFRDGSTERRLLEPHRARARRDVHLVRLAGLRRFLAVVEHRGGPGPVGARGRNAFYGRPAYITKRGFPRYPNFIEGFPGVACSDSDNPRRVRRLVDRRQRWPTRSSATSAAPGPGLEHLRRVAGPRRRPLHRAVQPRHRQPGAGRRQPLRPRDALRGRRDRARAAPELRAADGARLGPHVAVPLGLRRRGDRPLPRRRRHARAGHRLRAGSRPLLLGHPSHSTVRRPEARPRPRGCAPRRRRGPPAPHARRGRPSCAAPAPRADGPRGRIGDRGIGVDREAPQQVDEHASGAADVLGARREHRFNRDLHVAGVQRAGARNVGEPRRPARLDGACAAPRPPGTWWPGLAARPGRAASGPAARPASRRPVGGRPTPRSRCRRRACGRSAVGRAETGASASGAVARAPPVEQQLEDVLDAELAVPAFAHSRRQRGGGAVAPGGPDARQPPRAVGMPAPPRLPQQRRGRRLGGELALVRRTPLRAQRGQVVELRFRAREAPGRARRAPRPRPGRAAQSRPPRVTTERVHKHGPRLAAQALRAFAPRLPVGSEPQHELGEVQHPRPRRALRRAAAWAASIQPPRCSAWRAARAAAAGRGRSSSSRRRWATASTGLRPMSERARVPPGRSQRCSASATASRAWVKLWVAIQRSAACSRDRSARPRGRIRRDVASRLMASRTSSISSGSSPRSSAVAARSTRRRRGSDRADRRAATGARSRARGGRARRRPPRPRPCRRAGLPAAAARPRLPPSAAARWRNDRASPRRSQGARDRPRRARRHGVRGRRPRPAAPRAPCARARRATPARRRRVLGRSPQHALCELRGARRHDPWRAPSAPARRRRRSAPPAGAWRARARRARAARARVRDSRRRAAPAGRRRVPRARRASARARRTAADTSARYAAKSRRSAARLSSSSRSRGSTAVAASVTSAVCQIGSEPSALVSPVSSIANSCHWPRSRRPG